jgi:hypothetical protein
VTAVFAEPTSGHSVVPVREAGGDNEVPRDGNGKPIIRLACTNEECEGGRVPSKKRAGNTVQCPRCKGKVEVERSYKRASSYGEVLEDKTNLMAWGGRMVLIGAATDPTLLREVLDKNPEFKQDKDWLNRRAESAKKVAGAEEKADKGTYLHGLSELRDLGQELPSGVTYEDIIDMDAYARGTTWLDIHLMEKLVVVDSVGVAGTPDRVSRPLIEIVAPDGKVFGPNDLLITDLKTGTVEYGALKMCVQLALYSRGKVYEFAAEKLEDTRIDMGNVSQEWGLIMNLPAGTGKLEIYWANLTLGWEAVELSGIVRQMRNRGRKALTPLVMETTTTEAASAA